jgi:hypothetical protein
VPPQSPHPLLRLIALHARAGQEASARLQAMVLLLLLAELHAAGGRNERRMPWMRTGAASPAGRRIGVLPLTRGSVSGRRPRG